MKKKDAFVFDFDDTLIKDTAKSYLYRDGKFIKSMNADEYHHHVKQPNEHFDFSEFDSPKQIDASLGLVWHLIENYYNSGEDIFILTARQNSAKKAISEFLFKHGVVVPMNKMYCIGGPEVSAVDIPIKKEEALLKFIYPYYERILFFEDNDLTVNRLKQIPNVYMFLVK